MIAFIVFMERAQRRILVQYPEAPAGNRMFGGESSHLPLKLNTSGVIPAIFASSLLLLPATVGELRRRGAHPGWLSSVNACLGRGHPVHILLYVALIVFFAFFYTSIVFNPEGDGREPAQAGRLHSGLSGRASGPRPISTTCSPG